MPRVFRFTMTESEFDRLLEIIDASPEKDDPIVYRMKARQLIARSRRMEADMAQPAPYTRTRTKKETSPQ